MQAVVNFTVFRLNFNIFLISTKHSERFFRNLKRQLQWVITKVGIFLIENKFVNLSIILIRKTYHQSYYGHQKLNYDNAHFWLPSLKLSYEVLKIPLSMLIWLLNPNEFHEKLHEVSQLSAPGDQATHATPSQIQNPKYLDLPFPIMPLEVMKLEPYLFINWMVREPFPNN